MFSKKYITNLFVEHYKIIKRNLRISAFHRSGKIPWSRGYFEYKWQAIGEAINNPKILKIFSENEKLPVNYGIGLDERIIEYPWLVSNLFTGKTRLLDAGSILNFSQLISHPKIKEKDVCIVTLSPESNCFYRSGVSYLFADIRDLPFKDNHFDEIACISTLEHVGMDNTMIYSADPNFKENKGDFLTAVNELHRVLKPGGRLFITVPFGAYEDHQFFQQFNGQMLDELIGAFAAGESEVDFYQYSKTGWQLSTREKCANEKYFDIHKNRKIDPDKAAAARAVACLILTK